MCETVKDPPTQAVENITQWQKTPDMLCSWAAADTGMASLAKCIQTKESKRILANFYEYLGV